jgi:transposase
VSLQNILARNVGRKMKKNAIKALREDRVTPLLAGNDDISLAGRISKDAIDSLTMQIRAIEVVVEKKIDLRKPYDLLLSMPGVGRVLALTIMMETGTIDRFVKVGNYVSYCRKGVPLFAHCMENAGDLDPSHPSQSTVRLVVTENFTASELLRVINSRDLI